jgi:hypothetical protein
MPPLQATDAGWSRQPANVGGTPVLRRSQYLAATALARSAGWGGWPAALVALPLALAPSGAGAAPFNVTTACTITGAGVCDATVDLVPANTPINFLGGVLTLNGANKTYGQPFTLDTSTTNTLNQDNNKTTFTGVFSDATTGGNITVTNVDPTTGNPFATNKNFVIFNKAETYTGSTVINSGATLELGSSGSIATSSTVTVNGTFNLSNASTNVSITSLSGAGSITLNDGQTLTLSKASDTFSGVIKGGDSGSGLTIAKGTEVLSGASTYTGPTTVGTTGAATLVLNGKLTSSSITVTGGATPSTLAGVGSTTGNVVNNGTLNPYSTVSKTAGAFTIGGTYTQGATGVFDISIGGLTTGTYSQLHVTGTADLGTNKSVTANFDVDTLVGFTFPAGTSTFTDVLDYASTSTGDFKNLAYNGTACTPSGTETWLCSTNLTFVLATGTAGSITTRTLTVRRVRTPEPATIAILATGLLGLAGLRRRRA